jgi:hypothetical protein
VRRLHPPACLDGAGCPRFVTSSETAVAPRPSASTAGREQKSRPDRLTGVNRHDGRATVSVTKEMMAAFDSGDLEPGLPQGRNDLATGDPRKTTHATVIF